jgi:molybdopterin-biosynthesis enzyme MoeA-like protein
MTSGKTSGGTSGAARPAIARPERARILIVGDEILSGEVCDRNAAFLAAGLTALGARVEEIRFVPDRRTVIVRALGDLLANDGDGDGMVLVAGGIGPTHDDVTREAVAESLGAACCRHPEAERRLREGYGPSITEAEVAMADLPAGATLLSGLRTGVFGFACGRLLVLPGVPHLLEDIFHALEAAWRGGAAPRRVELLTALREGHVADGLRTLQECHPGVAIGSYPYRTGDGYRLRIVLRSADGAALEAARSAVEALIDGAAGSPGPS